MRYTCKCMKSILYHHAPISLPNIYATIPLGLTYPLQNVAEFVLLERDEASELLLAIIPDQNKCPDWTLG